MVLCQRWHSFSIFHFFCVSFVCVCPLLCSTVLLLHSPSFYAMALTSWRSSSHIAHRFGAFSVRLFNISCLRNYVYYYIIIVIIIFLYCYYVHTPSTAIFGGRNTKHTYAYHRTNEKNALSLKHSTYMNICVHHRILYNKNWHREYINAGSISYTNLIQWQQQTTTF